MKYLDAKKRLIFMMATLKYIRLLFKKEITITDDEIQLLVAKSLPIIFKDYTIRTEDANEIIAGIKSNILIINNSLNNIKTKDSTTLETIKRDTIHIDTNSLVSHIAELIASFSNKLVLDDSKVIVSDHTDVIPSQIKSIQSDDVPIDLEDKLVLLIQQSIPFIINNDAISTADKNIIVDNIKSVILYPDSNIQSKYEFVIETIVRNSIHIKETIKSKTDLANLITSISKKFYTDSVIKLSDYNKLKASISNTLKFDSKITVNNVFEFAALYSDLVVVNDLILSSKNINIQLSDTKQIKINNLVKTINEVVLSLGDFVSVPFEINAKLFIKNKIILDTSNASNTILNSIVNLKDCTIDQVDESRNLVDDLPNVDVTDCLQLLRYRYALLQDWELTEIDDILALDMSEFIYVLK